MEIWRNVSMKIIGIANPYIIETIIEFMISGYDSSILNSGPE